MTKSISLAALSYPQLLMGARPRERPQPCESGGGSGSAELVGCVGTLLLPGPALIAGSALCSRVTWDCSCLWGSRGRGGGGIRWVQAPARGGVRPWAPEQHGCSGRDSGLPGCTVDLSCSWTVWILGLGAVFTLLSAQPEVLRPPPSTCQAAQGAGPASVSVSRESRAWAFGPAWCGPTPLSQSDGPMVVCGSQRVS